MSKTSRYFEPLATAVASGRRIRDAATESKCCESTAYRICRTPEFRRRVAELRTAATDAAVGALTDLATDAVAVLRDVMNDTEARRSDRVSAAKSALQLLTPLSELSELRTRLDALEAKQGLRVTG